MCRSRKKMRDIEREKENERDETKRESVRRRQTDRQTDRQTRNKVPFSILFFSHKLPYYNPNKHYIRN